MDLSNASQDQRGIGNRKSEGFLWLNWRGAIYGAFLEEEEKEGEEEEKK